MLELPRYFLHGNGKSSFGSDQFVEGITANPLPPPKTPRITENHRESSSLPLTSTRWSDSVDPSWLRTHAARAVRSSLQEPSQHPPTVESPYSGTSWLEIGHGQRRYAAWPAAEGDSGALLGRSLQTLVASRESNHFGGLRF